MLILMSSILFLLDTNPVRCTTAKYFLPFFDCLLIQNNLYLIQNFQISWDLVCPLFSLLFKGTESVLWKKSLCCCIGIYGSVLLQYSRLVLFISCIHSVKVFVQMRCGCDGVEMSSSGICFLVQKHKVLDVYYFLSRILTSRVSAATKKSHYANVGLINCQQRPLWLQ